MEFVSLITEKTGYKSELFFGPDNSIAIHTVLIDKDSGNSIPAESLRYRSLEDAETALLIRKVFSFGAKFVLDGVTLLSTIRLIDNLGQNSIKTDTELIGIAATSIVIGLNVVRYGSKAMAAADAIEDFKD